MEVLKISYIVFSGENCHIYRTEREAERLDILSVPLLTGFSGDYCWF